MKKKSKAQKKVKKVMTEYKEGKLHSGSKKGPVVTSQKQAIAIALSEGRKASGSKSKRSSKKPSKKNLKPAQDTITKEKEMHKHTRISNTRKRKKKSNK